LGLAGLKAMCLGYSNHELSFKRTRQLEILMSVVVI
jgi:hypothetical protein